MTKEGCIINPATGRAVKTTTPLGKKLMAQAQQLDDEVKGGKVLKAAAKRAAVQKEAGAKKEAGGKIAAAAKRAVVKKPEPPKPKAAPKPKATPKPKSDSEKLELLPTSITDVSEKPAETAFLDLVYEFDDLYDEGYKNMVEASKWFKPAKDILKKAKKYDMKRLPDDKKLNALKLFKYYPELAQALITIRVLENGKELTPAQSNIRSAYNHIKRVMESIVREAANNRGIDVDIFVNNTNENLEVLRKYMTKAQLKLIPKLKPLPPSSS